VRLIRSGASSAVGLPGAANRLREFPHSSVNGQRRLRIWLSWFPCNGLNHSQPPLGCYIELCAL